MLSWLGRFVPAVIFCLKGGGGLQGYRLELTLECCGHNAAVDLDHREFPALPRGRFRKNVECPNCDSLVILEAHITDEGWKFNQEVILD